MLNYYLVNYNFLYIIYKIILKTTYNRGFFSWCSIKLKKIIEYYNKYKKLPNKVDSSAQFKLYKLRGLNEDITYHF